ncbi:DMT family transporter [Nannocystis pusilla]|uniref:DMT family transporter n=1 Tax=Nannocystis pusilla TaxID=889268 RepID=UPI003BF40406
MAYLFLSAAIVFEVVATSFLRFTAGERATWWSYPIVVCGYVLAFVALALALGRGIPLGIAYAVWAGVGVVLVALVSRFAFAETLTGAQLVGVGLVVAGVVLLELGGGHPS